MPQTGHTINYPSPTAASIINETGDANAAITATSSKGTNSQSLHHQQQHQRVNTSSMSDGMSRMLANSTSLLANESYIAGMSSDSELTSSRHHHRPYSSQSRVYHAHPAPRISHGSSRVSHYSDSAATTYMPSANKLPPYDAANSSASGVNSGAGSSSSNTSTSGQPTHHHQYHPHNHPRPVGADPNLTPQGSQASSGSASSSASVPTGAYHYQPTGIGGGDGGGTMSDSSAPNTMMSAVPQLQQANMSPMVSSRPLITSSGRQLPHRPFKQSLSIDHYGTTAQNQHQHIMASPHHHHLTGTRQPLSPHFDSMDLSTTYHHQHQNQLDNQLHQQQRLVHSDQMPRYDQRSLRSELDMIEKQAASLRLYDSGADRDAASGLPPLANRNPASSSSSPRHPPSMSPVTGSSSSQIQSSAIQHQQQFNPLDQHNQAQNQMQLARKQPHHHHPSDLYASHLQYSSSPADWLPPMGMNAHHLNRAAVSGSNSASPSLPAHTPPNQFKQTISIDHYPVAAQQHQQKFYSPNIQGFREHYRSMGYSATGGAGGAYSSSESPTHSSATANYVLQSAPSSFDNQTGVQAACDTIYHHQYPSANRDQHQIEQRLAENTLREQPRQSLHESNRYLKSTSGSNPAVSSYTSHQDPSLPAALDISKGHGHNQHHQQQQVPHSPLHPQHHTNKLQHQMSSSSSDSRSGSLKSSNADLNRSSSLEHHQGHKLSSSSAQTQQQGHTDHLNQSPHAHQQPYHLQQQQQQHQHQPFQRPPGVLRRGYTSAVSSLSGSVTALNESSDLSPSHASHLHLTSSTGASGGHSKRVSLYLSMKDCVVPRTSDSSTIEFTEDITKLTI